MPVMLVKSLLILLKKGINGELKDKVIIVGGDDLVKWPIV